MSDGKKSLNLTLIAAGVAGLVAFLLLYRSATPQAAVTLEVTRDDALATAQTFLEEQGASLERMKQAIQFSGNSIGLVFLQRTVGLDEASRWAREEVPIWSWVMRWFEPTEKEEWQIRVNVDGTVAGLAHLIEEAAAGADLAQEEALPIAEAFLQERGWNLDEFERVEASSEKQDNRTDHHFTWEKSGSTVTWQPDDPESGSGSVRVSVDVQGDQIGSYRHFLRVPEDFERDLGQTLSVGGFLAIGSLGLTFVLILIALGLTIARYRRDDIRWRPALQLAGLVTLLFIGQGIASWPRVKFTYQTELAWGAYVGTLLVGLLFVSVLYGIWVLFAATAGESLGREVYPKSLTGFVDAARGRLLAPVMARASLNGYALGFFILGYLTVFYVIARRYFGAWLPAEGPYSEIFNYYLPFLAPLTVSLVAATTEELTYRLFGISLVKRYLNSTFVALLVPAMIWAFAHSNYAVFPVYLRGIELTVAGLIFGYGFLRFGLLACVVAHFVIDAVLLGMPLLSSGNTVYLISGIIVMGFALLPAVLSVAARGRGQATQELGGA
ncbi:MAG: CPBP family intramembrane metalloprotease [Gemmatimonadales bacterium]|nr:CPBP family intramembrane metalloprotease [Gemmatimonadales bacterium]NIN12529.1 CPBP family intramembrane metalloprotease [Gemmatimonadales bacterium]NIN50900.1 CPBP family intramembrane metalloprotease [Gemmatimonadales bacterium]NIP08364.1 CPBP family intramembrane metalloprotease [Gemmatimonadales bacterium]NIR03461.1 CPBP family intramembrane metalloprotease [Gemmatimonadales bacterium]